MGYAGGGYIGAGIKIAAGAAAAYQAMQSGPVNGPQQRSTVDGGTANWTRKRLRTGRFRRKTAYRLSKEVVGNAIKGIWRWQAVSESVLGPGAVNLGWTATADSWQRMPIHFMSLTQFPASEENLSKGCTKKGLHRIEYDTSSGNTRAKGVDVQDFGGVFRDTGVWQTEYNDLNLAGYPAQPGRVVHHNWTQVSLQLYGTTRLPVRYRIMAIQVPEHIDPFASLMSGATVNDVQANYAFGSEIGNMWKDIVRDVTANPLAQNGRIDWLKDARIIKQYTCTIQPMAASDQQAESSLSTGVAAIHRVDWWLRHDRYRNYCWSQDPLEGANDLQMNSVGWDANYGLIPICDVEWGKRVILLITATSPRAAAGDKNFNIVPSNDTAYSDFQPTYDIRVRNCFAYNY